MPNVPTLATRDDVIDIWPSAASIPSDRLDRLVLKAERSLVGRCPWDLSERLALFETDPTAPLALDPVTLSSQVAQIVKRFLSNQEGLASRSRTAGPYSESKTFVGRNDKNTGGDVRGEIRATDEDVDALRPAVTFTPPGTARVQIPRPEVFVPAGAKYAGVRAGRYGAIVADLSAIDARNGCEIP